MPIKIPDKLPARDILEAENIFVMNEMRAQTQDIRPLRIAVMNLMPSKIVTETQLIRLLSNTSLQIDLTLICTASHTPKNTPAEHMKSFYKNFFELYQERFDGLIITGAPVEEYDFEEVDYWPEICCMMDWSKTHVWSTLHICWASMAGLYYHHGIPKYPRETKLSGIFEHTVCEPKHPLVRGFDEIFYAPHSRYTEVHAEDICRDPSLQILAASEEAGPYLIGEKDMRRFYIVGHPEYDYDTLALEYRRDLDRGINPAIPAHYFPQDDPSLRPRNHWRSHAHLLVSNWLNYIVYQQTPYDLNTL